MKTITIEQLKDLELDYKVYCETTLDLDNEDYIVFTIDNDIEGCFITGNLYSENGDMLSSFTISWNEFDYKYLLDSTNRMLLKQ